MTFLIVLLCVLGYVYIGATAAARHHSIASKRCHHGRSSCFKGEWCGHTLISIWVMGLLWPLAFPAIAGIKTGLKPEMSRAERKQQKEIDAANHKLELAEINAQAIERMERANQIGQHK